MWLQRFLSADGDSKESTRRKKEFKKEVSRKAKELAGKHGIATDLLSHVLEETAELSPSPSGTDRLTKIIKSGFGSEDLTYSPIEEVIEQLGPKLASRILKFQFGKFQNAWAFAQKVTSQGKFLQTMLPPFFLTKKEWVAYHVQYHDFLIEEKSALISEGRPKTLPEIPLLLRVLPLTLLEDDRRLLECGALEAKGLTADEIKKEFFKTTTKTNSKEDDLREYREKIYSLYLSAYENLHKNLSQENFNILAFEISKVIREEFTPGELEGLKEIESQSNDQLKVFNVIERVEAPELPDIVIRFALSFLLPAFEASKSSDVRAKLSHLIRFTELGFPVIEFDFWAELKRRPDEFIDIISVAEDVFYETRKFSLSFIKKISEFVLADEDTHKDNLSEFQDTNTDLINTILSEIDAETTADGNEVKIKGTGYIFKNGFRELHWRKYSWKFKDWERHIVKAFYEAYISKTKDYLDADDVHALANQFHFKFLAKKEEGLKRRYMFTDVFKAHPLSGCFFISKPFSNKQKSSRYTINPKWTPLTKTKPLKKTTPRKKVSKKSRSK